MSLLAPPAWATSAETAQTEPEEFQPPQLTEELQAKIGTWHENQVLLKGNADVRGRVSLEMEMRKELGNIVFNNAVGTSYFDVGEGYKLKHTVAETHTLKGDVEGVLAGFTESEADMLITWKPSLNVAAYKALPPEQQARFNGILEIKPGAPTLEIIAPKKKS